MKNRQRGWAGLVALLIALAIVAFLAKDALMRYALSSTTAARKATADERARNPYAPRDANEIRSAPTPIERARSVDDIVKRAAEEREQKMP